MQADPATKAHLLSYIAQLKAALIYVTKENRKKYIVTEAFKEGLYSFVS
jgi:hypothetical protein